MKIQREKEAEEIKKAELAQKKVINTKMQSEVKELKEPAKPVVSNGFTPILPTPSQTILVTPSCV